MSRNARDKIHAQSKRPAKFKRKLSRCNFKVSVCIRVTFWVRISRRCLNSLIEHMVRFDKENERGFKQPRESLKII